MFIYLLWGKVIHILPMCQIRYLKSYPHYFACIIGLSHDIKFNNPCIDVMQGFDVFYCLFSVF